MLNGGYNPPSISILDVAAEKEIGRAPVEDGWLGLTFSPKGDFVYVGGGSRAEVLQFKYSNGALTEKRSFPVVPAAKRTVKDFIGDVAVSPDGRLIYAADLFHDSVVVINPQSGMLIERFKTGRRPYRILFHPDGKSFFVTSWTDGSLGHYQTDNGALLATVRLAPHPKFERKGRDLYTHVSIPLTTAVLGGEAEVATLSGKSLRLKIPPATQNGQVFRLKGHGMPVTSKAGEHGDLYATVDVELPKSLTPEQRAHFEALKKLEDGVPAA